MPMYTSSIQVTLEADDEDDAEEQFAWLAADIARDHDVDAEFDDEIEELEEED